MTANTPVGIKYYKIPGVNLSISILDATCEPQGLTVIAEDGSDSRMADVIWVDDGARNPKVPIINEAEIKPTMDTYGVLLHEGQQVAEPSEMTMFPHTSYRQMGISHQEMEARCVQLWESGLVKLPRFYRQRQRLQSSR